MKCTICNKEFNDVNYKSHYKKCEYIENNSSQIIDDYVNKLLTSKEISTNILVFFINRFSYADAAVSRIHWRSFIPHSLLLQIP